MSNENAFENPNNELENENIGNDSCDIWKDNGFKKYQKRPSEFESINLAEVVAYLFSKTKMVSSLHRDLVANAISRPFDET